MHAQRESGMPTQGVQGALRVNALAVIRHASTLNRLGRRSQPASSCTTLRSPQSCPFRDYHRPPFTVHRNSCAGLGRSRTTTSLLVHIQLFPPVRHLHFQSCSSLLFHCAHLRIDNSPSTSTTLNSPFDRAWHGLPRQPAQLDAPLFPSTLDCHLSTSDHHCIRTRILHAQRFHIHALFPS